MTVCPPVWPMTNHSECVTVSDSQHEMLLRPYSGKMDEHVLRKGAFYIPGNKSHSPFLEHP